MRVIIEPGPLRGSVAVPASKSHVHRLLLAAALSQCPGEDYAETDIYCPEDSADVDATLCCLNALNCAVRRIGDRLNVLSSVLWPQNALLDCRESGSTLRFLLPICAALPVSVTLTGRGRLPSRPLEPLLSVLRAHGARIEGNALPLNVGGGLKSGEYSLPGNVSSQYFTGLLFALPLLPGDSVLRYTSRLESRPYVDLTLSVLRQFGVRAEEAPDGWRIPGSQTFVSPGAAVAEGDWSAAAFWLGANALGSEVKLTELNSASAQGDRAAASLLKKIGGSIDVIDTPDLMPILSAVAAALPGVNTRITGAARLRLKESDRLSAMAAAICALGGEAEETPDGLVIHGKALTGGTVDGQNDHRVVMSAAIAATACRGPVTILGAEAVNKSYPMFFVDFSCLGGVIHA